MQMCTQCYEHKEETEFYLRKGKPQAYCKICQRKYCKAYYRNNKYKWRYDPEYSKPLAKKHRNEKLKFIKNYLANHPCTDCGEQDLIVLEFDHVRGVKFREVMTLVQRNFSVVRIQEEIDKCDVVCANCHKRRTYLRNKSWRTNANKPPV